MISFSQFKKVAFVWGWTGGHVTPIIGLIHEHNEQAGLEYIWIGWSGSLEETTATKEGIKFYPIHTMKLTTSTSLQILIYPFILIRGIIESISILRKEKPDLVFSKWGPWAVSVGIASRILHIPLWIHESDIIPGKSNRLLGNFAARIFLWFDAARKYFPELRCSVVWQIISPDLRKAPKEYKYWKTEKKHILVICGSQWSKNVFEAIAKTCPSIDIEWIVLLWILNKDSRNVFAGFQYITLYDWIDAHTLGSILSKADLVITRGSATSLAEIDLYKKKKIIIPLPWSSQNHQFHNAMWYKENRDDIIIEERDMINTLPRTIKDTLKLDIVEKG